MKRERIEIVQDGKPGRLIHPGRSAGFDIVPVLGGIVPDDREGLAEFGEALGDLAGARQHRRIVAAGERSHEMVGAIEGGHPVQSLPGEADAVAAAVAGHQPGHAMRRQPGRLLEMLGPALARLVDLAIGLVDLGGTVQPSEQPGARIHVADPAQGRPRLAERIQDMEDAVADRDRVLVLALQEFHMLQAGEEIGNGELVFAARPDLRDHGSTEIRFGFGQAPLIEFRPGLGHEHDIGAAQEAVALILGEPARPGIAAKQLFGALRGGLGPFEFLGGDTDGGSRCFDLSQPAAAELGEGRPGARLAQHCPLAGECLLGPALLAKREACDRYAAARREDPALRTRPVGIAFHLREDADGSACVLLFEKQPAKRDLGGIGRGLPAAPGPDRHLGVGNRLVQLAEQCALRASLLIEPRQRRRARTCRRLRGRRGLHGGDAGGIGLLGIEEAVELGGRRNRRGDCRCTPCCGLRRAGPLGEALRWEAQAAKEGDAEAQNGCRPSENSDAVEVCHRTPA